MADLKNREVFHRDPLTTTIPNDGVAKVIEPQSANDWAVLRYELESFVCDGEYKSGLERILSAFLTNFSRPQQQAVWVSGFYGSGKSHLVRVLEYLWRDVEFPDGARARSLVTLPSDIRAHLTDLSHLGMQEGGLWSAAGTLGAGADAIRLALLAVLFRSAKLPEQYPAARLVLWLKQNGLYDAVASAVQSRGKTLAVELRNMYVSPALAESLLEAVPGLAYNQTDVRKLLREQYPNVPDISDADLYSAMTDVLSLQSTTASKSPLTLLVFDELQQFIGNDPERTLYVQNVVETCASRFGSHLLFIGTGQSALQANTELSKLQGRFSIGVTLSDIDVEKVVREVVLRKAPDKIASVKGVLDACSGEIDRHLAGTRIGVQPEDAQDRIADYPILPVRRRLWERILRSVDSAGTAGQLRTQLRIVHDTARKVGDKPLGTVAPSDEIYRQLEAPMLQSGVLPRDVTTMIGQLNDGTEDGRLRSRLCSLIFMLGKLSGEEGPLATGVRATADALADLLVDDLTVGSAPLRQQVPTVLQTLVDDGTLILVGDEYRLQTRESAEWETDYRGRLSRIHADDVRVASERGTALRESLVAALKDLIFLQGTSKTSRKYDIYWGPEGPPQEVSNVPVRVQDGWSASERSVREEAQQAGVESPTVIVFLPRLEADELRQTIARLGAADETVKTRAVPQTVAGREARAAMESRAALEKQRLRSLVDNIIKNARVYQGGGNEIVGDFPQAFKQAVDAALTRLFPRFSDADQSGWDRVVTRAAQGAADSLSALGYTSDVEKHPVCLEIRSFVGGAGKKGSDARRHFSGSPYGWPRDTVDGALLALLAGGFLRASRNGQPVTATGMNQQQIGVTDFFSEGVTVSALQRIAVRRVASDMGLGVKSGEEAETAPVILARLMEEAQAASGEAPLPEPPDLTLVKELQDQAGNQQIVGVAENADDLLNRHKAWSAAADAARQRLPEWRRLERLLHHARGLAVAEELRPQMDAIRSDRSLLSEPNPVPPLISQVTVALREAISEVHGRLAAERDREVADLEASDNWLKLEAEDRRKIIESNGLGPVPALDIGDDQALMDRLEDTSLKEWNNRILVLKTRVDQASGEAARLVAPEAVTVRPPPATLNSRDEVDAYVQQLKQQLLAQIDEHPVIIP